MIIYDDALQKGKDLSAPFKPALGLSNKHLQTLYSSFFKKSPALVFEIETFTLGDGDFLECYWYNKPKKTTNKPIVTLFHGLAGSYKSPYIQTLMQKLDSEGFSVVLMHFRGCSGKMNKLARSYHSGDTADALAWLTHLKQTYTNATLFAIGYSLGGNMLLKLLGELKEKSFLRAAVSISAPLQLDICAYKMDTGFSKFYQYILLKDLRNSLHEKYKTHDLQKLIGLKKSEICKLTTFWKFDDRYTAPIHGFSSVDDYYKKSSAKGYLQYIQTDTLIIHALDDPFMTQDIIPKQEELSPSISLEVYPHGGHVGFISGSFFKPVFWLENRIITYLKNKI